MISVELFLATTKFDTTAPLIPLVDFYETFLEMSGDPQVTFEVFEAEAYRLVDNKYLPQPRMIHALLPAEPTINWIKGNQFRGLYDSLLEVLPFQERYEIYRERFDDPANNVLLLTSEEFWVYESRRAVCS